MGPAIYFDKISVRIDGINIIENLTAVIPGGSVTAIIGPNGAGKTTLLKVILGKIRFGGSLAFTDDRQNPVPARFGYVPQSMDFDRGLPMTVLDFLVLVSQNRPLWLGRKSHYIGNAMESLQTVEATHLADRRIGRLSGGELQRVLLASALLDNPNLLLLDEPVSGIDIAGERLFCDLLDSIQHRRFFTMVIVSHDLSVVSNHADRVICLNKSLICEGDTHEILTPANLQAVFGHHTEIVRNPHLDLKERELREKGSDNKQ
jgi:zinc transport system ATP-binding protein